MDPAPPPNQPAGIDLLAALHVLQSAGGALWVQAQLHGQLAAIEWQEEKNRLLELATTLLAGFACAVCALLFAGGLALTAAWDTGYRLHVLGLLTLLSVVGAAVAWHRLRSRPSAGSFAASREELAADVAALKHAP